MVWRRLQVSSDENGDDERVDGDDTRHNDGYERLVETRCSACESIVAGSWHDYLHDEVWSERSHAGDADAGLGCAICSADT